MYRKIYKFFFFCGMMFLVSGCASPELWYKSGYSQIDFDLDNQECLRIAQELGRQATITGEKINLAVFNSSYNNCLFSRGWTHTSPGLEKKNVKAVELAKIQGNVLFVFDEQLMLPLGFHLIKNQFTGFEDIRMQTLFFQGDGPVFFNIIIQEAFNRKFEFIDYPINDPFFVFEKGKETSGNGLVSWTVFFGEFKEEYVVGIGAYYFVDKNKRINFVMTKAISFSQEAPPSGLHLAKSQKLEVEAFSEHWLGKIKTAFGAGVRQ